MVTETTGSNKESKDLIPSVEVKPAVRPDGLTDEQAKAIKDQAAKAVKALVEAKGSDALTVEDQITNVGIQDQKQVSSSIALLQERMGNVFYSDNKDSYASGLTKDIANLQDTLAKINPKDIQKSARYQILKIIPFFGNRLIAMLKTSSDKRLTLQEFVDHLEESLKAGELNLRQDNAQLKVMYEEIEDKQALIATDAFFAETLMEELDTAVSAEKDEKKKNNLQKALFRIATRAQDLRTMENVHEQFFTSIEMTRDNNNMLISTVQRMLTMGMQVVYVAFAIHAALMRQKNVLEAERGTRDFLGGLIVKNATMINDHVKEIGDLYKEPVIAMDKLSTAISQLEQAIDATNKLKAEGIERARENISKIKIMTEEIKTKAGALPESDVKSLEASKITGLLTAGR
jgi:uncharacterized protein YaaN involved in tellurite resistance